MEQWQSTRCAAQGTTAFYPQCFVDEGDEIGAGLDGPTGDHPGELHLRTATWQTRRAGEPVSQPSVSYKAT